MAKVKWIKLCTDIFDDEKIMLIDALPERDSLLVIWFKLLCLAGKQNNGGVFMFNDRIAYTDEMLATIFQRPVNIVRLALSTFETFDMIEIVNNTITIPNWEKHQNLKQFEKAQEQTRERVAKHREKQRLLTAEKTCNAEITPADKGLEVDGVVCADAHDNYEEENGAYSLKSEIPLFETEDTGETKRQNSAKKPVLHKYGEYKNVLLSDEDMGKLQAEFPTDYPERIERLSGYIASTGKSYKNHLATIRNWARKENPAKGQPSGSKQFQQFDAIARWVTEEDEKERNNGK